MYGVQTEIVPSDGTFQFNSVPFILPVLCCLLISFLSYCRVRCSVVPIVFSFILLTKSHSGPFRPSVCITYILSSSQTLSYAFETSKNNIHTCISTHITQTVHMDGSAQNCSICITNALEILQSCTKSSIHAHAYAGKTNNSLMDYGSEWP